jgi:phosphatidylglycerophosphatase A
MKPQDAPAVPRLSAMLARPHQLVALVFGIGAIRVWPGTIGTVAGFALFFALQPLPPTARAVAYGTLLVLGSWAILRTGEDLGAPDHNGIVFDETIAMSLVLEFVAPGAIEWIAAFALFRLFDVWKPWPIHLVHRTGRGGFMVILDDLLAALYAVVMMRLAVMPALAWLAG